MKRIILVRLLTVLNGKTIPINKKKLSLQTLDKKKNYKIFFFHSVIRNPRRKGKTERDAEERGRCTESNQPL